MFGKFEARSAVKGLAMGAFITQLAALAPAPAFAQDGPARPPPTGADFARLEAQVNEQRQLIIQLMQNEQQRYDMLLRLVAGHGAGAGAPQPAQPDLPAAAPLGSLDSPSSAAASSPASPAAPPVRRFAAVEGKVTISGGDLSDIYVFVENVKGPPVRGRTIEIKQENKQFSPRLAVVQTGTQVVFPNLDTVFHNVFSPSPKNAFDLGSYRSGDKPRSVVMSAPGLVEIFCNVHQKMNANVMVVPNNLYTKVHSDGSFRIENVPVGARRLVAWSPSTKIVHQKVDVTPSGARTTFALEYEEVQAHLNKAGQPYGSYK
jgi:plastocyanin